MLRHVLVLLGALVLVKGQMTSAQSLLGKANNPTEIVGQMAHGLEPHLFVNRYGSDWDFDLELFARTNFAANTWLKVTNQVGCKLQCWLNEGVELQSTNPSVLAAASIPVQTSVSDILLGVHPANTRGLQWWPVAMQAISAGESYPVTGFRLGSVFDFSQTNSYLLQVIPLIYNVETNGTTAHLVEFPPIRVRLTANGDVRKAE